MKYDNAGEVLTGTRQFAIMGKYNDLATGREKTRNNYVNANEGSLNGQSKMFVVTIDPQGLYTLGVSQFSLTEIAIGMKDGDVFSEGTEFMCPTGRVRVMDGKLRYTRNKQIYKLPEIRV